MTTLSEALSVATRHWEGRNGSATMLSAAGRCVAILGPGTKQSAVGVPQVVSLLAALRGANLSPKSVQMYYGAFKRMLALGGFTVPANWPLAPTPPRKTREPIRADDLERLIAWMETDKGWRETADLARLMRGTGLRVGVEGLDKRHLKWDAREGEPFGLLHVTGKGGHERLLPVVREDTREILGDETRLAAMRRTQYRTHLRRWSAGVLALGIKSKLASPHSVRHGYATEVLKRSGGNLALVQELLGHADPATTAKYVSVDIADKAGALTTGA